MTVNLVWTDLHSPLQPGGAREHRFASYNTLEEAFEQAAAGDGLDVKWITDESGDKVLADKDTVAAFAAAKAKLAKKHAEAVAAMADSHAADMARLVGDHAAPLAG